MKAGWHSKAGTTFSHEKRSVTVSVAMIVTNNPLGCAAGAQMFGAGGNVIDAAIASLLALPVVESMIVGVFGAGISTIRRADGSRY